MIQEAPPLFRQNMCRIQSAERQRFESEALLNFRFFSSTFFGPDHEEKVLFSVGCDGESLQLGDVFLICVFLYLFSKTYFLTTWRKCFSWLRW